MSILKRGLPVPDPEQPILPEDEDAVLEKLAKQAVKRGMTVPAILFLESVKPLNFIASQTMVFFEPIVQSVFSIRDYDTLRSALEKRESIEILLLKIEDLDAVHLAREKRIKKYLKALKKDWTWYQRWVPFMGPRITIPEEVLNPPEKPAKPEKPVEPSKPEAQE